MEIVLNMFFFGVSSVWRPFVGLFYPTAHICSIILYTCLFNRKNFKSKIIICLTILTTAILISELGTKANQLLSGSNVIAADALMCLSYVFIVGFSLILRKYSIDEFQNVPNKSAMIIVINDVIAVLLTCSFRLFFINNIEENFIRSLIFAIVLLICLYVICLSTYLIVYFNCFEADEREKIQAEKRMIEADKVNLMLSHNAINDMKEVRHDLKNQFSTMNYLIDEKKYEELKDYFAKFLTHLESISSLFDCGNNTVSAIINMEIVKSKESHIDIMTNINIPHKLPFDDCDLCSILSNLIDNALEALNREGNDDKKIYVTMNIINDYLHIQVKNKISILEDEKNILAFKSSKKDPQIHGIGHKIVERLVDKYNGLCDFNIDKDMFVAEIMLDMKKGAM